MLDFLATGRFPGPPGIAVLLSFCCTGDTLLLVPGTYVWSLATLLLIMDFAAASISRSVTGATPTWNQNGWDPPNTGSDFTL